ncbi:MAG: hypothetical protein LLG01_12525 [Planctomycetaceae bacterium]|nr:hypothetical protein [Planctomycetaceae bacterium]
MTEILKFLIASCSFLYQDYGFRFVDSKTFSTRDAMIILAADGYLRLCFSYEREELLLEVQPDTAEAEDTWWGISLLEELLTGHDVASGLMSHEKAIFLKKHMPDVMRLFDKERVAGTCEKLASLREQRNKKMFGDAWFR